MKTSVLSKICCATGLAALMAFPVAAQLGGDLPQEAKKGMETAMLQLESQGAMTTRASLAQTVGQDKIDRFLAGAVLKLQLAPDGSYEVSTKPGGELVSFDLGKQSVKTPASASMHEQWQVRVGSFEVPKRQQKVKLTMRAGSREVTVDCFNRYRKTKEPVTFYVGPLNGLFCLGLAEDDDTATAG